MNCKKVDAEKQRRRFRIACRMLRNAGHLNVDLPAQRRNESPVDWLVRFGLAPDPWSAAEMLIVGRGLQQLLDELEALTDGNDKAE